MTTDYSANLPPTYRQPTANTHPMAISANLPPTRCQPTANTPHSPPGNVHARGRSRTYARGAQA